MIRLTNPDTGKECWVDPSKVCSVHEDDRGGASLAGPDNWFVTVKESAGEVVRLICQSKKDNEVVRKVWTDDRSQAVAPWSGYFHADIEPYPPLAREARTPNAMNALKVLEFIEWGGRSTPYEICPWCGNTPAARHDFNCGLASLIKEMENP